MMEDVGTSANKIIQLDSNGKIPAVDGSLVTGVVAGVSGSSDPTLSTNPSGGVGTKYKNTTDGEMFICTDATVGANTWINVGGGEGRIPEVFTFQGAQYGYCAGGYNLQSGAHADEIQKYSYASDANGTDVGDTLLEQHYRCGATGTTHGYTMGGESPSNGRIEKWSYASDADSTEVGVIFGPATSGTSSSATDGYIFCASGNNSSQVISRTATATDGNAIDWADCANPASSNTTGCSSETYGYRLNGGPSNDIEKYPFASQTNATNVGDLTLSRAGAGSFSSTSYGFCVGQTPNTGEQMDRIDRFSFASDGNATDFSDLNFRPDGPHGNSSTTHGYIAGGSLSGPYTDNISKIAYSSTGTATDVGNLYHAVGYTGGTGANY